MIRLLVGLPCIFYGCKAGIAVHSAIITEDEYKNLGGGNIELLLPDKLELSLGIAAGGTCVRHKAIERGFSKSLKVPVNTISNIINKYNIQKLDYMNIDIEGYDELIINEFDFSLLRPTVISIEDYSENINEVITSTISQILNSNGYDFVARAGLTSIFILKNI